MQLIKESLLSIPNMTCGGCARRVARAVELLDGVDDVKIDLRTRCAQVRHDLMRLSVSSLLEALAAAEYPARVVEPQTLTGPGAGVPTLSPGGSPRDAGEGKVS